MSLNEKDLHFVIGPDGFKNIRNYIHNYLGLTKEEIRKFIWDFIEEIVQEEIQKVLNDEARLHRLIEENIVREIRRNDNHERHSFAVSIMDDIYCKIDKVIHEEVRKRLVIELKEVDNGNESKGTNIQKD